MSIGGVSSSLQPITIVLVMRALLLDVRSEQFAIEGINRIVNGAITFVTVSRKDQQS